MEREAQKLLQENSQESVIGAVEPDSMPVSGAIRAALPLPAPDTLPAILHEAIDLLWLQSDPQRFGFSRGQFAEMLLQVGEKQNWGSAAETATDSARAAFLQLLRIDDLLLARACAAGNETAWDVFLNRYREILYRAAYAITREESIGRELADSLYADLYGLGEGPVRRSRLESFMGRGSLAGWLRSVLAQRFVDGYRKTRREESLDEEQAANVPDTAPAAVQIPTDAHLTLVSRTVSLVLGKMDADDRFLLASYYLDGRTLWQIAKLLAVHESTISRRLDRLTQKLRKSLLAELQKAGLNRRAAQEGLETDVRDLEVNVRKLLQAAQQSSFHKVRTETVR